MRKVALLLLILASMFVTACDGRNMGKPLPDEPPYEAPSELIRANPELNTFEEALERANLFDKVDIEDNVSDVYLTIVAPTDAAFEALFAELGTTKAAFLDRADLPAILKYHLAPTDPDNVPVRDGSTLTTLEGGTISVNVPDSETVPEEDPERTVFNGGANTVELHFGYISEAIIYVVDTVLLPISVE